MALGSTWTRICRALPPTMFTPPTPSFDSKRTLMTSLAMSVISRIDRSVERSATVRIGASFGSNC